jgi:hypothetical protein
MTVILGQNPTWPEGPGLGTLRIEESTTKQTVWLVPKTAPVKRRGAPFDSSEPTTMEFRDVAVRWQLEAERVKEEGGETIIEFKKPKLQDVHPPLTELQTFQAIVVEGSREKAKRLLAGQKVTLEAEMDFAPFQGVDLFYGVGKNQGKLGLSIRLQRAKILD